MLRRFRRPVKKEGLTKDIKRVAYYEKPSEKRRRRIRRQSALKAGRACKGSTPGESRNHVNTDYVTRRGCLVHVFT